MSPIQEFKNSYNQRLAKIRSQLNAGVKPESLRNATGNLWKLALKDCIESISPDFTVKVEYVHENIPVKGRVKPYLQNIKSDLTVYYKHTVVAVIESKDYFTIDYLRRAISELIKISTIYPSSLPYVFMGRWGMDPSKQANEILECEGITPIVMIDEKRNSSKTVVNTDFTFNTTDLQNFIDHLNQLANASTSI